MIYSIPYFFERVIVFVIDFLFLRRGNFPWRLLRLLSCRRRLIIFSVIVPVVLELFFSAFILLLSCILFFNSRDLGLYYFIRHPTLQLFLFLRRLRLFLLLLIKSLPLLEGALLL